MDSINTETTSALKFEDVCSKLDTDLSLGLSWKEAERRISLFGYNELNVKPPESLVVKYLEQVRIINLAITFV